MSWRSRTKAYVLSPHPLALEELSHRLAAEGVVSAAVRLQYSLTPSPAPVEAPRGSVCVVDACFPPVATELLVSTLTTSCPEARVLVLAEELSDAFSFPLLRLGVKALLTYTDARTQLLGALASVATGGCWLPRRLLARFLDTLYGGDAARPELAPVGLSRREQEVLDALLQNLSNKEIGGRLNISERTVKFHVSNLLAKFSVERRSDLILKSLQNAR